LPDPLKILDALQSAIYDKKYENNKNELSEILNILNQTLNRFLNLQSIENFKIQKSGHNYKFIDKQNIELNLYQISEGYRTNIVLITDIFIRILTSRKKLFSNKIEIKNIFKNVKGTIIIDEFDKHLHPIWQRTFLSALETELPNIQFVLSTHNVVALQSAEGHKAFILNENSEIDAKQIPVGYSIEALYKEFIYDKNFSNNIESLFDEFYFLLDKLKSDKLSKEENLKFKKVTKKLLQEKPQVELIVSAEIRQFERQSGLKIEL